VEAAGGKGLDAEPEAPKDSLVDDLVKDVMVDKKEKDKPKAIPVYTARMPTRPCGWIGFADGLSYAVWAGLRPMTELEYVKMRQGPRNPEPIRDAPKTKGPAPSEDRPREPPRVTYWGALDLAGTWIVDGMFEAPPVITGYAWRQFGGGTPITLVTPSGRAFQGTHGGGTTPAGKPGAPLRRLGYKYDPASGFDTAPADWPKGGACGLPIRLSVMHWECGRSAPRLRPEGASRLGTTPGQAGPMAHDRSAQPFLSMAGAVACLGGEI